MKKIKTWLMTLWGLTAGLSLSGAVTIDPPSRTFKKDGGGGSVLTSGTGTWAATTDADWITISPRTSGDAGVSCVYVVNANFSADTRTGKIFVDENVHTVTQTGYPATLNRTAGTVPVEGGSLTVDMTVDAGVSWTAKPNVDWLSVSPASGTSSASFTVTAAPYTQVTTRTGSVTIAGKTYTVTQTGTDVLLTPMSVEEDYGANVIQITVTALATTRWSVEPQASWISVVDGGNGHGDSAVLLAIGANPSAVPRVGTVTVGSKTLTVKQKGRTAYALDVLPKTATAAAVGAYGNIAVSATPDLPWVATSLSPWLTLSDTGTGTGNGNIPYVASANPTLEPRTGKIRVTVKTPYPEVDPWRALLWWNGMPAVGVATNALYATVHASADFSLRLNQGYYITATRLGAGTSSNPYTWKVNMYRRDNSLVVNAVSFSISGFSGSGFSSCSIHFEPTAIGYDVYAYGSSSAGKYYSHGEYSYSSSYNYFIARLPWDLIPDTFKSKTPSVPVSRRGNVRVGDTGIVEFRLRQMDCVNRILNCPQESGYGSTIYVNEDNLLVLQNQSKTLVSDYKVNANTDYWLMAVYPDTHGQTSYYVREKEDSTEIHYLWTQPGNRAAFVSENIGNGQYPSQGTLVNGEAFLSARWDRNLNEKELVSLAASSTQPKPVGSEYNDLIFWLPCDSRLYWSKSDEEVKYVYGLMTATDWYTTVPNRYGYEMAALRDKSMRPIMPYGYGTRDRQMKARKITNDFSASFWVKGDTSLTDTFADLFSLHATNYSLEKILQISATGFNLVGTRFTYPNLTDGSWRMVTVTYSYANKSFELFVNGNSAGVVSDYGAYTWERDNWIFNDAGLAVDDLAIFNVTLTDARVKALYAKEKPQEQFHEVTQGVVEPTVSQDMFEFPAEGGSGTVDVTVAGNVGWTAVSDTEWCEITSEDSARGSQTVFFDVEANPSVTARTAEMTLGGKTVTVRQAGLRSTVTFDADTLPVDGGMVFIGVETEGNALWEAVSDVPWLTVVDGASGLGSGEVMVVADPYTTTSQARVGSVTVAGQKVYVTQRGYQLSIEPKVAQIGSNSGAGTIGVAAPIDAVWEALVTQPWITIIGGRNGVGSGTLRYSVAANTTGETRTGKIIVSGEEYTITQMSSLLVNVTADGNGTVSGGGAYDTGAVAELRATAAAGYVFSHWTGDWVGSDNPARVTVDTGKTVTAHFVPTATAAAIAQNAKEELGLYTKGEMKDLVQGLAMDRLVLERNDRNGKMSVKFGIKCRDSLNEGGWRDLPFNAADMFIENGKIRVEISPTGKATQFFMLQGGTDE